MTADVRFLQEVFINKQLHMIFLIVHKSKYTDRTRCNIKEFLHISFIAEGKSGNAKLGRYFLCLKLLVAWQEQQIEVRFLAVAEKQVFADYCIKHFIHIFTSFNGHQSFMVNPLIRHLKCIKKIISTYLFFKSARGICGTSVFKL